MNYSGILHFADQRDCFFLDDGKLRIRISVGRGDIGSIILHIVDKYVKPEILDTRSAIEMRKLSTDYARDYFCADIDLPQTAAGNPDMLCLRYYFEIRDFCGAVIWYGDSRFFPGEPTDIECMFDCPVLSRLSRPSEFRPGQSQRSSTRSFPPAMRRQKMYRRTSGTRPRSATRTI